MFGHKFEAVRGIVVGSRLGQAPGTGARHQERIYTVDVQRPNGSTLRAEVSALAFMNAELPAGSPVHLEWNPKTDEVRFDPHHPVSRPPSVRDAVHLARELRGEMASGGLAATIAGLAEAAAEGKLGPGVHVTSGNTQIHVSGNTEVRMVGGEQTAELMQALMAGGEQRAAAVEKIKQMRADMIARASQPGQPGVPAMPGHPGPTIPGAAPAAPATPAAPEGFSSSGGPSTFDQVQAPPPVTPAAPVTPPAAPTTPSFSSPAVSFTPPAAPSFEQVTRQAGAFGENAGAAFGSAGSFGTAPSGSGPAGSGPSGSGPSGSGAAGSGSFGAFGDSFGGSFGQDTKAERIARLQDMRTRGQLSQEQFEAQRQQILDEI